MKNNEHACNRFWNVVTVFGTRTVLPKERSNVSGTVSITLCVTESVTYLSIRFNHNVGSPYAGGNDFNYESFKMQT